MRWWKKWEHEDHQWIQPSAFRAQLKSERCGSDSQLRTTGIFNRVDNNGGAVGFETWMKCWWGIDCETGKNGGVGLEMLQFSRGKQWCWFWHDKELNGFGLVVRSCTFQSLPNSCRTPQDSAGLQAKVLILVASPAKLGRVGQSLEELGRTWAEFGRIWQDLT